MNQRTIALVGLQLSFALMLGSSMAEAKKRPLERYQANALAANGLSGSRSAVLQMNIYKWSSDDDREEVLDAIKEATDNPRAYRAVPEALRNLGKAGYMFLAGGQGWPIRYAREIELEGKRRIILAADRPVTFSEVYAGSAVRDFDITLILLDLDEASKGEGIASVGTEVKWDEEENRLKINNFSSQPVRLGDVRPIE